MRHALYAVVVAASLLPAAVSAALAGPADRVYRNGVILTADVRNSSAEALAIRDGRIVYVGGNQGLSPYIGATTVAIDLHGRFAMPSSSCSTATRSRFPPRRSRSPVWRR
jgi:hypothetical protein